MRMRARWRWWRAMLRNEARDLWPAFCARFRLCGYRMKWDNE